MKKMKCCEHGQGNYNVKSILGNGTSLLAKGKRSKLLEWERDWLGKAGKLNQDIWGFSEPTLKLKLGYGE
jgi:hypothetical protein